MRQLILIGLWIAWCAGAAEPQQAGNPTPVLPAAPFMQQPYGGQVPLPPPRVINPNFHIDEKKTRAWGEEMVKLTVANPNRPLLLPRYRDLSDQFSHKVPLQRGGTCHVYAGVDLFEAACKRYLQKEICISRPYAVYRHLRTKMQSLQTYSPETTKGALHHFFGRDCDAGCSDLTLERLFNGYGCTAAEFQADKEIYDYLSRAMSEAKVEMDKQIEKVKKPNTPTLAEVVDRIRDDCSSQFPVSVCTQMDKIMTKGLGKTPKTAGPEGVCAETADADLKACMNLDLQWEGYPFSRQKALELLKAGIPFTCQGRYDFKEKEEEAPSGHEGVVVGYYIEKPGDKIEDATIHWKERHATPKPNGEPYGVQWFTGNCERIVAVYKIH